MRSADVLKILAERGGGVITRRAALAAGLTDKAVEWAVAGGELHRLRRGCYALTSVWAQAGAQERHRLLIAAAQHAVPGSVAVADSAAVLLGLPVPAPPMAPRLTLARDLTRSGGRGADGGTRGRRALLALDEVMEHRGLLVTVPARTVVDCARHLSAPWALAVGDAARRHWRLGAGRLDQATARNPAAPGHRAAVWVAEHARPEPESPLESLARAAVILGGYPAPVPQVWVRTHRGDYRVDLIDADGVVVEADGRVKYSGPDTVWQEMIREDALRACGLEVVRFTIADHHSPRPWLARYRAARALARRRPATPGTSHVLSP